MTWGCFRQAGGGGAGFGVRWSLGVPRFPLLGSRLAGSRLGSSGAGRGTRQLPASRGCSGDASAGRGGRGWAQELEVGAWRRGSCGAGDGAEQRGWARGWLGLGCPCWGWGCRAGEAPRHEEVRGSREVSVLGRGDPLRPLAPAQAGQPPLAGSAAVLSPRPWQRSSASWCGAPSVHTWHECDGPECGGGGQWVQWGVQSQRSPCTPALEGWPLPRARSRNFSFRAGGG